MTKEEFIKLVSKIDQTGEDEFKAVYNSPELFWKVFRKHFCNHLYNRIDVNKWECKYCEHIDMSS